MGNFKDFDLDLKVNKGDKDENVASLTTLTVSNCTCGWVCQMTINACPTIAYDCDTISYQGSCDCSPSDMTACGQVLQGKGDILPHC